MKLGPRHAAQSAILSASHNLGFYDLGTVTRGLIPPQGREPALLLAWAER